MASKDLLSVYSDLSEQSNKTGLDLLERLSYPDNKVYGSPKHHTPKPDREAELEASLFNSESEESKHRRNMTLEALMEYYDECQYELEQAYIKIKEDLIEEFHMAEEMLERARLTELAMIENLNSQEIERHKAVAKRLLEELLASQKHIADLLNEIRNIKQTLYSQWHDIIFSISNELSNATNNLFENFVLADSDNPDSHIVNNVINSNRDEFRALGGSMNQRLLDQPMLNFSIVEELLRQGISDLLHDKISINNNGRNIRNIPRTVNEASNEITNSLFLQNPLLKNNIIRDSSIANIVKSKISEAEDEEESFEISLSSFDLLIAAHEAKPRNIVQLNIQSQNSLNVHNNLLPAMEKSVVDANLLIKKIQSSVNDLKHKINKVKNKKQVNGSDVDNFVDKVKSKANKVKNELEDGDLSNASASKKNEGDVPEEGLVGKFKSRSSKSPERRKSKEDATDYQQFETTADKKIKSHSKERASTTRAPKIDSSDYYSEETRKPENTPNPERQQTKKPKQDADLFDATKKAKTPHHKQHKARDRKKLKEFSPPPYQFEVVVDQPNKPHPAEPQAAAPGTQKQKEKTPPEYYEFETEFDPASAPRYVKSPKKDRANTRGFGLFNKENQLPGTAKRAKAPGQEAEASHQEPHKHHHRRGRS